MDTYGDEVPNIDEQFEWALVCRNDGYDEEAERSFYASERVPCTADHSVVSLLLRRR